jgi:hypothetical protein
MKQKDFSTFLRHIENPKITTKKGRRNRNRLSKTNRHSASSAIVLDFSNPNLWERRPSMNTHAVLIMGESRVGKSSIIARVPFPPFSTFHRLSTLELTLLLNSTAITSSPTSMTQAGTTTAKKLPSKAKPIKSSSKTSAPSSHQINHSTCETA